MAHSDFFLSIKCLDVQNREQSAVSPNYVKRWKSGGGPNTKFHRKVNKSPLDQNVSMSLSNELPPTDQISVALPNSIVFKICFMLQT